MVTGSQVHLVRHAESVHNVTKDFSKLDPSLTSLGFEQAAELGKSFPYAGRVGVVITSPLRRAIQTALTAFSGILDKQYFDSSSGQGVENGASLIIEPLLQERSALACDTGSDRAELEKAFPRLTFDGLGDAWPSKDGIFAADDEAVQERARKVRRGLVEQGEKSNSGEKTDFVVVTHGVFMKFLAEEPEIDLPKAGWKSYTIQKVSPEEVNLVSVATE
ncbi:Phosphoglycerate mutase-like protein [Glarea lozoyensis ATCC 20868]|nr:Phosphoglycerate mutase-like protein [Glarea lozoyensis ATCC 20868]EPE34463.1 Phosphoglycerate mutase-like protein [Glarea lozoyensis ATCC 20868]